jgi:hypothetical protein
MWLKCLFLALVLVKTEATCQILKSFKSQKDEIILELFNNRYDSKRKKKKFLIKLFNYISKQTYSEFDDTMPYERKFAYFFIELYHLGINDEAVKKKYFSNMIQQTLLLASITDTTVLRRFYEENKDILSEIPKKANFDWVVSDLLSCYERLSLLSDSEILKYKESSYLLHWGYEFSDALNNKKLKFYKPSFYIDWLYAFWIDKRKKHTAGFFYKLLTEISKSISTPTKEQNVWEWDRLNWEKTINSRK